jgi:hypothetical protein
MKHFSEEYMQSLINEHKLVSASVTQLLETRYQWYARQHGADVVAAAASNLRIRKVELEAQIDLLDEFLKG